MPINPFKKDKTVKSKAPSTLQEAQQDFNQTLFELGNLVQQKHMVKAELTRLDSEINNKHQVIENKAQAAQILSNKIKAEAVALAAKGEQDAQSPKAG